MMRDAPNHTRKKVDDFMYANFRDIFVRINKRAEYIFDVWKARKKKKKQPHITLWAQKYIFNARW